MPTIKDLNQRHPSTNIDRNTRLRAIYKGGDEFKAKLSEFLPQRPAEPAERYALRKKESVYRNYTGPILDYFTALLFSSTARIVAKREDGNEVAKVDEYYSKFHEDADRLGTDLEELFKAVLGDAMQVQRSWIWLQHPTAEGEPRTLAEFEESRVGDTWLTNLKDEDVLDWETDDEGNLAWAVLFSESRKRAGLGSSRSQVVQTWRHVQATGTDVYRITFDDKAKPVDDTEVPRVASIPHRYGAVPLVCLELKPALWLVERLESPQLAHYRLSNMQQWGMAQTCYAMPVIHRDAEEEKPPTMGAGYGLVMGIKERVEYVAPPADVYGALGSEIKSHKDEIYRIANSMALGVENNAAAVGRSAESKQSDAKSTVVVVQAFAKVLREAIERVYDLVSAARGDEYTWAIDGFDDIDENDLPSMVETLKNVEDAGGIPSKTFQVEMRSRIAESMLPDLSEQKKKQIRDEIEAGTEDMSADAKAEREEQRLNIIGRNLSTESAQAKLPKQPSAVAS